MPELSTLARPYARAAFEHAAAAGTLDDWLAALHQLAAVAAEAKVARALADPLATRTQRAQTLLTLMGDSLSTAVQNFVQVLARTQRLNLLTEIATRFAHLKAEREKLLDVRLQTARALTKKQRTDLEAALATNLKRRVVLTVDTDPSLLGGALIQAGDTRIDGSLRGRLHRLADSLSR
ncbi:MAG: F0F1 ATP synthase subunit delta [Cellvibrionales bacterium]|nr:F0F1 ATP synthase subunit delta [Cellvibrionales bacterium]